MIMNREAPFARNNHGTSFSPHLPKLPLSCIAALLLLLVSCSVMPEEGAVRDAITRHFNSRGYRIASIEIGDISSLPLKEREYMAPEKFNVQVISVTLELLKPRAEKPQPMTFKNASVTVSRGAEHGVWTIDNIEGIPVT